MARCAYVSCFDYKGKEVPSDAVILIHLFVSYMNEKTPFSQYVRGIGEKGEGVYIQQTAKEPTSFRLIVDDQIWDVVKGRENAWMVLVAFLWVIKERGGYIGLINLNSRAIGLLSVVE